LPSPAEPLRLVLAGARGVSRLAVAPGQRVRLRFSHSIYGSLVEESFAVVEGGFELVRLRYAEQRTAEYYGHEHARRDGRWWTVESPPRVLASIALRVSPESNMRLRMGTRTIRLDDLAERGGAVHMRVEKATAA
jgi:hypothetical protein